MTTQLIRTVYDVEGKAKLEAFEAMSWPKDGDGLKFPSGSRKWRLAQWVLVTPSRSGRR